MCGSINSEINLKKHNTLNEEIEVFLAVKMSILHCIYVHTTAGATVLCIYIEQMKSMHLRVCGHFCCSCTFGQYRTSTLLMGSVLTHCGIVGMREGGREEWREEGKEGRGKEGRRKEGRRKGGRDGSEA